LYVPGSEHIGFGRTRENPNRNEVPEAVKKIVWSLPLLVAIVGYAVVRSPVSSGSEAKASYADGHLLLDMSKEQTDARMMKDVSFRIRIRDAEGNPVQGAAAGLKVLLSMPGMFCGTVPAQVSETEPGVYTATGVPVMRGKWQAEAIYRTEDGAIRLLYPFKAE